MPECDGPRKECESVALCGYIFCPDGNPTDEQKITRYAKAHKVNVFNRQTTGMGHPKTYEAIPDYPYYRTVELTTWVIAWQSEENRTLDKMLVPDDCGPLSLALSSTHDSEYHYTSYCMTDSWPGSDPMTYIGDVVTEYTIFQHSEKTPATGCHGTIWRTGDGAYPETTLNSCPDTISGGFTAAWSRTGDTITRSYTHSTPASDPLPPGHPTEPPYLLDYYEETVTYLEPLNAALEALSFDDEDAIHGAVCTPYVAGWADHDDPTAIGTVGKARYRFGVPAGFSTEAVPRSYYEAQWDEVFFPEEWDAWNTLRLAYLARIAEREALTADYEAALVAYAADMAQYAVDVAAYPGLLAAYEAAMLDYYDLVDAYMVAVYAYEDWYWCELYTPGECGEEPTIPEWPVEPTAPVEPVEPAAPVEPTLPPLLPDPGAEPAPIPSLIGSRSWLWGGDMEDPWSEWFVLPLLTAPGEIRVVNLRIKCYKSTRLGVVPTAIGEVYEIPA